MALSIRDGNQTLTTLSTIVVGSAHIPAHSVVSLGSQAITDIAGAVSGVELGPNTISALENISVTFGAGTSITIGNVVSVTGGLTNAELRASSVTIGGSVSVSNLPSTQTVTFTQASVTFGQAVVSASNINPLLQSVATDNTADANLQFMKIGGHQDGSNQTSHIVHVSSGGAMKVDASGSSITFTQASVTFSSITGHVSVQNFPATQTVTFTTATITGSTSILNFPATQTVTFTQSSVTFGATTGSVSVLNFPSTQTIAGTVTANVTQLPFVSDIGGVNVDYGVQIGFSDNNDYKLVGNSSPLPISGTVTANVGWAGYYDDGGDNIRSGLYAIDGVSPAPWLKSGEGNVPISGTVTANVNFSSSTTSPPTSKIAIGFTNADGEFLAVGDQYPVPITGVGPQNTLLVRGTVTVGNSVTIGSLPAISGTVTANVAGQYFDMASGDTAQLVNPVYYDGEIRRVTPALPLPVTIRPAPYGQTVVTISGTVTVGNSVTIGSLPAVSGTITVGGFSTVSVGLSGAILAGGLRTGLVSPIPLDSGSGRVSGLVAVQYNTGPSYQDVTAGNPLPIQVVSQGSVTIGSLPSISGTVTIGNATTSSPLVVQSRVGIANRTATSFTATTSTQVLASSAARSGFIISNYEASGGPILYLRLASAAASTANFDIRLLGGESFQMLHGVIYTGEIRGIYSTTVAGAGGKVLEF